MALLNRNEACVKCGSQGHRYAVRAGGMQLDRTCNLCGWVSVVDTLDSGGQPSKWTALAEVARDARDRTKEYIAAQVEATVEGKVGKQLAKLVRNMRIVMLLPSDDARVWGDDNEAESADGDIRPAAEAETSAAEGPPEGRPYGEGVVDG